MSHDRTPVPEARPLEPPDRVLKLDMQLQIPRIRVPEQLKTAAAAAAGTAAEHWLAQLAHLLHLLR